MKKVILLVLAGAGCVLAKRQYDQSQREKALWAGATDQVRPV